MMSQFNQESYATGIMNNQQLNQANQALYNYCKVMTVPKLGAAPVVITILEGLVLTLIIAALGESLLLAVSIGASVSALFTFFCWLLYRYRVGASKLKMRTAVWHARFAGYICIFGQCF